MHYLNDKIYELRADLSLFRGSARYGHKNTFYYIKPFK